LAELVLQTCSMECRWEQPHLLLLTAGAGKPDIQFRDFPVPGPCSRWLPTLPNMEQWEV
jgi:hypothetical protein